MKILILDGFTLFQKDLDVSVFENYGEIITLTNIYKIVKGSTIEN